MPVGQLIGLGTAPTAIDVVAVPAPLWAVTAGGSIDQALVAGPDEDMADRLVKAKKEISKGARRIGKRDACAIFSLLAEASGQKPGIVENAGYSLASGSQLVANAATCKRGVYAAASYSEAGLEPSTTLLLAVTRIMRLAHQRAVKIL